MNALDFPIEMLKCIGFSDKDLEGEELARHGKNALDFALEMQKRIEFCDKMSKHRKLTKIVEVLT